MNSLLSVDDFNQKEFKELIERALHFKCTKDYPQYERSIVNIFFENSTRTKYSFLKAEKNLGLDIIDFNADTSSLNKGESLYDTLLTFKALGADMAVIRHPEDKFYENLEGLKMPIINAGAGCGEHPSQSLLDMMTIYEEFQTFQDLKLAIVGDLKHSRVAKSNMKLLKNLGAKLYFVSPEKYQDQEFLNYGTYKELDEIINQVDVVMLLRIQHERHLLHDHHENYCENYGLNKIRYEKMAKNAIIMHPGPINRNVEISEELIEAKKSRFVMQMTNGLYMRMAIIEHIILKSEERQ